MSNPVEEARVQSMIENLNLLLGPTKKKVVGEARTQLVAGNDKVFATASMWITELSKQGYKDQADKAARQLLEIWQLVSSRQASSSERSPLTEMTPVELSILKKLKEDSGDRGYVLEDYLKQLATLGTMDHVITRARDIKNTARLILLDKNRTDADAITYIREAISYLQISPIVKQQLELMIMGAAMVEYTQIEQAQRNPVAPYITPPERQAGPLHQFQAEQLFQQLQQQERNTGTALSLKDYILAFEGNAATKHIVDAIVIARNNAKFIASPKTNENAFIVELKRFLKHKNVPQVIYRAVAPLIVKEAMDAIQPDTFLQNLRWFADRARDLLSPTGAKYTGESVQMGKEKYSYKVVKFPLEPGKVLRIGAGRENDIRLHGKLVDDHICTITMRNNGVVFEAGYTKQQLRLVNQQGFFAGEPFQGGEKGLFVEGGEYRVAFHSQGVIAPLRISVEVTPDGVSIKYPTV